MALKHLYIITYQVEDTKLVGLIITINAPLFLKVRAVILFSRAKHIMGHLDRVFEGAETLLTPKLS